MSFRVRLALTMGALIVVISAAIWIYLPQRMERESKALIARKAETLAHLTAFTIHPALYFDDPAALDEALSGTRQDKDVAYVIVTDPGGKRLAAFHPERATEPAYVVTTPIRDGERPLATLSIGMSLTRVNRDIRRVRVAIGVLSIVILAAGLVVVLLISNVLTRPLRDVSAAARKFAAGDLSYRVHVHGNDEIGQLGIAFNHMATSIADRDVSLRDMSKRLLSVQEQERLRIAREVHDELGQALTALKIDLQQIGARDVGAKIDHIVDLVRRIATDLRPAILDDLGITAALGQQLRRVRESTGIATTLHVEEEPDVDVLTGVTLYRIMQEALSNVIRHANATSIEVSLTTQDGAALLEVRDNGRGFTVDANAGTLGLLGMRERAELLGGSVEVESRPGQTIVRARVPLGS